MTTLTLFPKIGMTQPLSLPEVPAQTTGESAEAFAIRVRVWADLVAGLIGYAQLSVAAQSEQTLRWALIAQNTRTEQDLIWQAVQSLLQGGAPAETAVARARALRQVFKAAFPTVLPPPK